MLVVAILGLAAVVASGRLGEFPPTVTDTPRPHVPAEQLRADDLRGLRLAVVRRGYSTQQVDELLERLASQLDQTEPASIPTGEPARPQQPSGDGIMGAVADQTARD